MVRSIACSLYTLKGRDGREREGTLLKFEFLPGLYGYSDCHPWPSLGDSTLQQLLADAKRLRFDEPLLQRALYFARIDARARAKGLSLFEGMQFPLSHLLLSTPSPAGVEEAADEGFTTVKVKLNSSHFEAEAKGLTPFFYEARRLGVKVRIDFNEKLLEAFFCHCCLYLNQWRQEIEFIEDPFPYNACQWRKVRERESYPLACDRKLLDALHDYKSSGADIYVLKPALHSAPVHLFQNKKWLVTSYLDHPLGQAAAAYTAAKAIKEGAEKSLLCGLLTHRNYSVNAFSERFSWKGASFTAPQGSGFGFDDLLQAQKWELIA